MKALTLVAPGFYPDSRGGAERQALILSEALARLGVDVTLVAPTICADVPEIEQTSFGRIERFHVKYYPNLGGRHMASFLAWTYWFRRRYGGLSDSVPPIYVFHARLHALGPALAAIASGTPLMIKLGGGGEASDFVALRAKKFVYGNWVQSLLLKRTDCFVANGSQIAAELKELGVPDNRIAVFPNGVILPPQERVLEALEQRQGNHFMFSGRMVPDKRVEVLFGAAQMLGLASPALRLTFLGDGPERDRLAKLASGLPATTVISFHGFVEDVYSELMAADFFVSASTREGQSNALLEAMSAGVIPIVFHASGVAEVVEHGRTGFVVGQSNPEAFAEAMRVAMSMPAGSRREMALRIRRFAVEKIGIDAIAKRILETLSRLSEMRRVAA